MRCYTYIPLFSKCRNMYIFPRVNSVNSKCQGYGSMDILCNFVLQLSTNAILIFILIFPYKLREASKEGVFLVVRPLSEHVKSCILNGRVLIFFTNIEYFSFQPKFFFFFSQNPLFQPFLVSKTYSYICV